uniref:Ovule protein n=1 Tax=Steinernema glaseri TaxID=37863 RepID=A0A1I7Y8R8_9BILA
MGNISEGHMGLRERRGGSCVHSPGMTCVLIRMPIYIFTQVHNVRLKLCIQSCVLEKWYKPSKTYYHTRQVKNICYPLRHQHEGFPGQFEQNE